MDGPHPIPEGLNRTKSLSKGELALSAYLQAATLAFFNPSVIIYTIRSPRSQAFRPRLLWTGHSVLLMIYLWRYVLWVSMLQVWYHLDETKWHFCNISTEWILTLVRVTGCCSVAGWGHWTQPPKLMLPWVTWFLLRPPYNLNVEFFL